MLPDRFRRKLTAIISADVEGYSRLMGLDEESTVRILTAFRLLIKDLIEQHRGRVVDDPGDNILAEFSSAVDAVRCAVVIQRELSAHNAELPEERRMQFRIGINLGDVIEEEERLYGDGVNITARIEKLADASGICISGTVYDQLGNRLPVAYEYMGEQTVKNIEKPVRVYRVIPETYEAGRVIGEGWPKRKKRRFAVLTILTILLLSAAVFAIWNFYFPQDQIYRAGVKGKGILLPGKPAIAVLPFENLSEDPEQERFADGVTDDLITNLSQISGLLVVSRKSAFIYKGKQANTQQIAKELNVQYILEGSVRKVGEQVLINVRLINASTGQHLWGERYDRKLKDVFAMQVEITTNILTALNVRLTKEDKTSLEKKGAAYLEAYLKHLHDAEKRQKEEGKGLKADVIFWESIKDSQQREVFEEYLKQFPKGIFAGLAKNKIKKIRGSAALPADDSEKPKKRIASVPPPPEGKIKKRKGEKAEQKKSEELFWLSIKDSVKIEEYEEFLRIFPNGIFAGLARIKIKTLAAKPPKHLGRSEGPKIGLAIFPWRFSRESGKGLKYFEGGVLEGLEGALSENPRFVPLLSYYKLGSRFRAKSLTRSMVTRRGGGNFWVRKDVFSEERLDVDAVCKLGKKMGVEAVLLYYYSEFSQIATARSQYSRLDVYLIDVNSKKKYYKSSPFFSSNSPSPAQAKVLTLAVFGEFEREKSTK